MSHSPVAFRSHKTPQLAAIAMCNDTISGRIAADIGKPRLALTAGGISDDESRAPLIGFASSLSEVLIWIRKAR
jgi:hypothetical protein